MVLTGRLPEQIAGNVSRMQKKLATSSGLYLQAGFVLNTDGFHRRRLPSQPAGHGPRDDKNAAP